ncbi:MAG TPA: NAD(P)H-binding protein, partial [Gemmatimonadales bacterium]|nr:NAD(P)H-binding protein [Gemmatimonadales bacterium]
MKVVIIGGTGLIGSKVVARLREHGHEAVPASPDTGVNALTGEGVAEALDGADVLIDVSNSPSFEERAVREFFETGTGNLLAAARRAGIKHYVILSVVGTRRLQEAGYFRGKLRQEQLLQESGMAYTIVHSTQFFEFIRTIVDLATTGGVVRLAPVLFQPIASDDVARAVGKAAVSPPVNGIIEIAGPEQFRLDQL